MFLIFRDSWSLEFNLINDPVAMNRVLLKKAWNSKCNNVIFQRLIDRQNNIKPN